MVIRFDEDKKNVDFIRLRFQRYRQTPMQPYTTSPTQTDVSILTFTLVCSF